MRHSEANGRKLLFLFFKKESASFFEKKEAKKLYPSSLFSSSA
jgi:hypothetical protein